MKTRQPRISAFTSEKARLAFSATYESMLDELWPARTTIHVPTDYGTTRVVLDGESLGAAPFVMLPGAGGNALMWHRHVAALKAARPVIAIDPPGEPGGSIHTRPFAGGRDLADWLEQALTGLDIGRAHLIGASNGGWVAIQHALHRPGRAATLTLLDPAGFGRITAGFVRWIILGGLAIHAPGRLRRHAASRLHNVTLVDDDAMRLVKRTMAYRRRLPLPPPLTDAELAALTPPVHLMLGGHSVMHDAREVALRAARVIPDVRVEIVPGAGHDLPLHSVDLVTARAIALARAAEVVS